VSCKGPIDFETLTAYWLGELPEQREAMIEEHLFGCAHCSRRLEGLAALAEGVRAAVHNGQVGMVVSPRFVEAMKQSGLRLREYRLEPGGSVNCTIRSDDDAVVSRLSAPLAGVKRLDIASVLSDAEPEVRFSDVPFDENAGEVVVIPSASWLKTMPAFTMRMRLIAVAGGEEKRIGEYTFNHVPS
jgi:anti-sigma factor RsiW